MGQVVVVERGPAPETWPADLLDGLVDSPVQGQLLAHPVALHTSRPHKPQRLQLSPDILTETGYLRAGLLYETGIVLVSVCQSFPAAMRELGVEAALQCVYEGGRGGVLNPLIFIKHINQHFDHILFE